VTETARAVWVRQAETFDDEPDHGLRDPVVRRAWAELLLPLVPQPRSAVLDVGCGTASLSVLLAAAGHRVCGVDLSGRMLVLVGGRWSTGAGLSPADCLQLVSRHRPNATLQLLPAAALWGGPIDDERYLIHTRG